MTHSDFAIRISKSISSGPNRILPSIILSISILLMSGVLGLGSSVLAQEPSSEPNAPDSREYHTRFRLGPDEGIHEVAIEGSVRFSPDETRIEWMEDGAYIRIITLEQGQKFRFDAEADENGLPTVSYKVDGRTRPYNEVASRYLEDILPVVFRELGHNELNRVQTTYDTAGATGVIQMISKIRSDYSTRLHVSAFLGLENLTDEEIIQSISLFRDQINSDSELTSFLYQTTDLYRERPAVRHAYLDCLNQFNSDIEKSRAIKNLFGTDSISIEEQPVMSMTSGC